MSDSVRTLEILILTSLVMAVLSNYTMYLKVGEQAKNMQLWKRQTSNYIDDFDILVSGLLSDASELAIVMNDSYQAMDNLLDTLNSSADYIVNRIGEFEANSTYPDEPRAPYVVFQAHADLAGLTVTQSTTVPFTYSEIAINDGNHYDSASGLFTAPVDGLYWLHATFKCSGYDVYLAHMVKTTPEGAREAIGFMRYHNAFEGSCVTLHHLNNGDSVGIYPASNSIFSMDLAGGVENSFAGYLVAEYSRLPSPTAPLTSPPPTASPATASTPSHSTIAI